jgi:pimeloyl-ACP methyl ester carboxylesterase
MPRRQLVVPGTGGGLYVDSAGAQAASILDLVTAPNGPSSLKCVYPPDADILDPLGDLLIPQGHLTLAYEQFEHAVPGWQFFDYDWRLDIRRSGGKLAEWLKASAPAGDRWRLVAHSQGGLVVMAAARALGVDMMAQLVQSVCFVGVPFFGTVNALQAILEGTLFGHVVPKEIVRTWPSVYQMMPSWGIFDGTSNKGDLLLDSTWGFSDMLPEPGQALDLTKHVDPGGLRRARVLRELTSVNYFDPLHKLDYIRIIQGNNRDTTFTLPNFPQQAGAFIVKGDTLVPDQFTRDQLPTWVQDAATIRRIPAAEHSLLCSDSLVFGLCL